ncbi:hypothetical protein [Limnobaculum xujianqingii]|uniref:hypothetical protein n=1 Tax=Limnobaculum xujianqingii TaxID=2738837 RepID=UPI0011264DB3|nr:hypothetical protein [Limnobaculum xujianqingii]
MKISTVLIIAISAISFSASASVWTIKTQKNLNAPYGSKVIEKNSVCTFDKAFYNDVNSANKVGAGVAKELIDEQMEKDEANINQAIAAASSEKEKNKIMRETQDVGSCYMHLRRQF